MKTTSALAMMLALSIAVGCGQTEAPPAEGGTPVADGSGPELPNLNLVDKPDSLAVCDGCGHLKGTEQCCAEGAEKCSCGMAKGSLACCKEAGADGLALCTGCGHLKGTEQCCAKDAEVCDCGWHKGSAACCKLDKAETLAMLDKGDAGEGDDDGSGKKEG